MRCGQARRQTTLPNTSGNDNTGATAIGCWQEKGFGSNLKQHPEENGDAAEAF